MFKKSENYKEISRVYLYPGVAQKHLNPNSSFSHFNGSEERLASLIKDKWKMAWPSPQKPGVFIIPLPPDGFESGVVRLSEDTQMVGSYDPHMGHREPRKGWRAKSDKKDKADYARAVVSHDDYEGTLTVYAIIAGILDNKSVNPDTFEEPMTPQTLMYNRYSGAANDQGAMRAPRHSSQEFDSLLRSSFDYWKDKAMFERSAKDRSIKLEKYSKITKAPIKNNGVQIKNAGLRHHLERKMPISDSIYRFGSPAYFEMITEARDLWLSGVIKFCEEDRDVLSSDIGKIAHYNGERVLLDIPFESDHLDSNNLDSKIAKKKKKNPPLGKPKRGGSKKFYVYVRCKGKVRKISFGSPDMPLRISEPDRRRSFVARHKCKEKKDRCTAGYWACRVGRYPHLTGAKRKYTWW